MSYKRLVNNFIEFCEAHPEVKDQGAGFEDQLDVLTENSDLYVKGWLTNPKTGGVLGASSLTVDVLFIEKLLEDRSNEVDAISDLHLIAEDFKQVLEDSDFFQITNFSYISTEGNTTEQETITIRASFTVNFPNLGTCEID